MVALLIKHADVKRFWIEWPHKIHEDEINFAEGGRIMETLSIITSVRAKKI